MYVLPSKYLESDFLIITTAPPWGRSPSSHASPAGFQFLLVPPLSNLHTAVRVILQFTPQFMSCPPFKGFLPHSEKRARTPIITPKALFNRRHRLWLHLPLLPLTCSSPMDPLLFSGCYRYWPPRVFHWVSLLPHASPLLSQWLTPAFFRVPLKCHHLSKAFLNDPCKLHPHP